MKLRKQTLIALPLLALLGIEPIAAQKAGQTYSGRADDSSAVRWAIPEDFDGSLVFCRGYYRQNRTEEGSWGWFVDYPGADYNLLIRIGELTKTRVRLNSQGKPIHVVVHLDSPLVFKCPIIFLSEVGTLKFSDSEVKNLRNYFKKGGFLWADDFWGSESWNQWEQQIRRVLPSDTYPMIDIPATHPIRNELFSIKDIPQVPNILFWYRQSGQTSEFGKDSREVHFRGIRDQTGKLIAVMTHNTDIGETMEMEGSDINGKFFYKFSPAGYGIAINIFLYALTH